jgi:hypothetical protein
MASFKDFNIVPKAKRFVGEKIKLQKLLNLPIKVYDFNIEPSKKKEGTKFLTVQIEFSGEKRIFFTGSTVLMDMIQQVPHQGFPFDTTIKQENDAYEFT